MMKQFLKDVIIPFALDSDEKLSMRGNDQQPYKDENKAHIVLCWLDSCSFMTASYSCSNLGTVVSVESNDTISIKLASNLEFISRVNRCGISKE